MGELRDTLYSLQSIICKKFEFERLNKKSYKIYLPFLFDDGDQITIGLDFKNSGKRWILSDGGDTFLHLNYHFGDFEFYKGSRKEYINKFLKNYKTSLLQGELIKEINPVNFEFEIFEYIQCILKVSNITLLEREIVEKTFFQDFKSKLSDYLNINQYRLNLDYIYDYYLEDDREKLYKIDCYIRTRNNPMFIFAIGSRYTCQKATITILSLEKRMKFHAVSIFKNIETIPRKIAIKLNDVVEKSVSNINQFDRFKKYFENIMATH